MAPRDPILGLTEQFNADPNPAKVNLGVGVYFDDAGQAAGAGMRGQAERQLLEAPKAKGYLPIDGIAAYDKAVQGLVFGADSAAVKRGRVATVQALGGTGGLKVGADFLQRLNPGRQGADQRPELGEPPRAVHERRLHRRQPIPTTTPQRAACASTPCSPRCAAAPGTIVVLHACCHNPTGCDLTPAQWARCRGMCQRGLVPFLDMAYQGFGDGIAEDGAAVQQFLPLRGMDFFVATSFSKSFSLYGERVGALSVVCASQGRGGPRAVAAEDRHPHQLLQPADLRRHPRRHRADDAVAARDVGGRTGRHARAHPRHAPRRWSSSWCRGVAGDLSYITRQKGMFSYSGLSAAQMQRLRSEFGVYGLDSGRICVAALNSRNIDAVATALARVMNCR
jgi:aromatic-amino-acid transaminase